MKKNDSISDTIFKQSLMVYLCFLTGLLLPFSCKNTTEQASPDEVKAEVATELQQVVFDLRPFLEKDHPIPAVEIDILFDHTLKKAQKYKAYPFQAVFDHLVEQSSAAWLKAADPAKVLITYNCVDGYHASLTLDKALSKPSYLAFTDLSSETELWTGKMAEKMPPFYLVWENVPYEDDSFVWPYGLTELSLSPYEAAYQAIFPEVNLAGFHLFEHNCLKCHSLNKIGGVMGPEFNYPKNILSYWKEEDMWAFINNPQSFRYNSKMPAITHLSRREFDEIVKYLRELEGMAL